MGSGRPPRRAARGRNGSGRGAPEWRVAANGGAGLATGQAQVAATGGAGLAHDAANLLAALMLYSELLASPDVLPERYRHYADDLRLLAQRSHALIDRLVAFGAEVDRERPLAQAQVSLVDVLMHCEGLLSTLAGGALQVRFGAQAALPVGIAAEQLERILVNLVRNATQATKNGGAVRIGAGLRMEGGATAHPVAAEPAGRPPAAVSAWGTRFGRRRAQADAASHTARTMVLTVDDSGCGMTEQQVARILNPAQVGPPEPWEPGQRRGIGLRVVRELVAASGGQLSIISRVGVGTRVEVQWPVVELEPASASADGAEAGGSDAESAGGGRRGALRLEPQRTGGEQRRRDGAGGGFADRCSRCTAWPRRATGTGDLRPVCRGNSAPRNGGC